MKHSKGRNDDYLIHAKYYGSLNCFSVEELYQAFKVRLIDELINPADLVNIEPPNEVKE